MSAARGAALILSNLLGIPSKPMAFLILNLTRMLYNSLTVTLLNSNDTDPDIFPLMALTAIILGWLSYFNRYRIIKTNVISDICEIFVENICNRAQIIRNRVILIQHDFTQISILVIQKRFYCRPKKYFWDHRHITVWNICDVTIFIP